jgi:hypothetical protein
MGACVKQIFAFQIDSRSVKAFREAFRIIERCRASAVRGEQAIQFNLEFQVLPRPLILFAELSDRRHQCFRNECTSILPEVPMNIGCLVKVG